MMNQINKATLFVGLVFTAVGQSPIAIAAPPPVNSPDWVLTHKDGDLIDKAKSVMNGRCCSWSDGRPLNDNGIRFNTAINHYEVRFNAKRWTDGTVSKTPVAAEEGDIWLEARPGMLEYDYTPDSFTMAWVGAWQSWGEGQRVTGGTLYCLSVKGGV